MKTLLEKYLNTEIGINLLHPFKIDGATLVATNDTYFSVMELKNKHMHHFPYASILRVVEAEEGIEIGGLFTHSKHFSAVIKVHHVVESLTVA